MFFCCAAAMPLMVCTGGAAAVMMGATAAMGAAGAAAGCAADMCGTSKMCRASTARARDNEAAAAIGPARYCVIALPSKPFAGFSR